MSKGGDTMTKVNLAANDIIEIAKRMDFESNDKCEVPEGYTKYLLCYAIEKCKKVDFFKDLFPIEQLKRMGR